MTTQTHTVRPLTTDVSASTTVSVIAAALIGLAIISVAGHVQAAALHDAAHDTRHTTGFPCH